MQELSQMLLHPTPRLWGPTENEDKKKEYTGNRTTYFLNVDYRLTEEAYKKEIEM